MAPLVRKKKADDENAAGKKEDDKKIVLGFRVLHVFDVSQTEGDELPSINLETTGDPGEKLEQLEALVASHGIELSYEAVQVNEIPATHRFSDLVSLSPQ